MDISMERSGEGANIGSLFQQIINDLKNTSPLWEDFVTKATKLHACLRATIAAIASYLEAFQKIADAATNSKGASKEIGTALTRVCLRHKAVETRLKTFTTAIMDCLILPLQDKIEDWKKQVAFIDKEHAKEHKRCRNELKKRSTDTLRLQKKAKKGQHQGSHLQDNLQSLVDSSMQDVNARRAELDEVERKSLRTVMIEERMRYCTFVYMLQPVVKEECEVMFELGHLQEVMENIGNVTKFPHTLPQASEELILESKTSLNLYPDSPGGSNSQACSNSLGSRKSSVCSISSMNSNSSGSPGHQFQRSLSQYSPAIRLKPGESKDSGFCSSPALALQATTVSSQSHAVSTWPPPSQDPSSDSRPHTISTAYEKGHQRPPLTVYTFQSPDSSEASTVKSQQERSQNRPPLPVRCSSLERPLSTAGLRNSGTPQRQCPSPLPSHITKEYSGSSSVQAQPTYVNMAELVSMAANRITNNLREQSANNTTTTQTPQSNTAQPNSPVLSSTPASSLVSPDSSATNPISSPDTMSLSHQTPQNSSPQTPMAVVAGTDLLLHLGGDGDITPGYNTSSSVTTNNTVVDMVTAPSPFNPLASADDIDAKTVGSVLEKANLFENLEKQQKDKPAVVRGESIYGRRDDSYKSTSTSERDSESNVDPIDKDTIEELNNLIGELDLFQKEHEEMEKKLNEKLGYSGSYTSCLNENNHETHSDTTSSSDRNEKLSELSECTTPLSSYLLMGHENGTTTTIMNGYSSNGTITNTTTATNCTDKHLYSDYTNNEVLSYIPDDVNTEFSGYENPSFLHLTGTECVVIRENAFPNEMDTFNHNNSEVITLKRTSRNTSNQQLDEIDRTESSPVQRFSSFRTETSSTFGGSQNNSFSSFGSTESASNQSSLSYHQPGRLRHSNSILEDRLKNKPAANPRPASLSAANVTRIARRASVNTVKPPPPVRRSSSVTPAHNLGNQSPANSTQNIMTSSSESLPPPPAYLLETGNQLVPGNVAGTVKALNEIKHTPASPGVLRRSQQPQYPSEVPQIPHRPNQSNNASSYSYHNPPPVEPRKSSSQGIYAKPQIPQQSTSSFKQQTSQAPQKPQGILSQIASRINPNKHQQQLQQLQQQQQQAAATNDYQSYYADTTRNEPIYVQQHQQQRSNDVNRFGYDQHNNHPMYQSISSRQNDGKHYKSNIPSSTTTSTSSSSYHHHHPHYQPQQQPPHSQPPPSSTRRLESQFSPPPHYQSATSSINSVQYASTNPFLTSPPATATAIAGNSSSFNYAPSTFGKSPPTHQTNYLTEHRPTTHAGSVISKTTAGFLENLNQKLAEQKRLSGKAYAVRSLINNRALPSLENNYTCVPIEYESTTNQMPSLNHANHNRSMKPMGVNSIHNNNNLNNINVQNHVSTPNHQNQVLPTQPDPRVCHESLMDQIKRGATLKRNRTINDRSAPKIH